jgi:hypothetical protein
VEAIEDPVLGQCSVLPIRRDKALRNTLLLGALGAAGWIIVLVWLLTPGTEHDPLFVLSGAILAVVGPLFVRSQLLTLSRPYFAMIGPNGFSVLGSAPILWTNVVDVRVRPPGGWFTVSLARPERLSLPPSMNAGFFMLGWLRPTQSFTPPMGFSPVPFEQLFRIFVQHVERQPAAAPQELSSVLASIDGVTGAEGERH